MFPHSSSLASGEYSFDQLIGPQQERLGNLLLNMRIFLSPFPLCRNLPPAEQIK
jgi:hypothetical protein